MSRSTTRDARRRTGAFVVIVLLAALAWLPADGTPAGAITTSQATIDLDAGSALGLVPTGGVRRSAPVGTIVPLNGRTIQVPGGDFAAYGTGTILHVDAITPPGGNTSLLGLDVAFSGSAFSSASPAARYANEMGRFVVPELEAHGGHGRGDGLELGIASPPVPLIGQLAEATAPPSTNLIEKVIDLELGDLVDAELLRGQAQARSAGEGCVLGSNLSYGLGSVLKLRLLDGLLSTTALPPLREVAQSSSRTRIVPGADGRLGLMSETRQTILPVTFFEGTPAQFTVEVLGEWVLRVIADGATSSVHYGPNAESPQTPILRVLDAEGKERGAITFQDFLEDDGLEIVVPGIATVVLGEDPRAIDGDASSQPVSEPTRALAAADVVRVLLANGVLADVRIGHMEAAVAVPAEGVTCPGITVDHTADPPSVAPDEEFTYTIKVTNPNDCRLTGVKVVETITAPTGVTYAIVSGGDTRTDTTITWNDIGPLGPGESKTLTVKGKARPGSLPGSLTSEVVATGVCAAPPDGPDAGADIPVKGRDTFEGPKVVVPCVVPDLDNLTQEAARTTLDGAGCKLDEVTETPTTDRNDVDKVIDQTPDPGTKGPPGTEVDVVIGIIEGPITCAVPNLIDLFQTNALELIKKAGCRPGDVIEGDPGADPDKVKDQTPDGGTIVPAGTEVDITVSGPLCRIDDLSGLDTPAARTKVEAEGCQLTVSDRPGASIDNVGKVVDQNPAAVAHIPTGSVVNVGVGGPRVGGQQLERVDGVLPRTGGIALPGLALALLASGLALRLTRTRRLSSGS